MGLLVATIMRPPIAPAWYGKFPDSVFVTFYYYLHRSY